MSEKRFTTKGIIISNYGVWDTDDKPYANDDVVDLLNEQQTEIAELREAIDYLKTVIRYTIPNQMVADVFKYIGDDYE